MQDIKKYTLTITSVLLLGFCLVLSCKSSAKQLNYKTQFPFSKAKYIEVLSYTNRFLWDTLEGTRSKEIIDSGKIRLNSKMIIDHIKLKSGQDSILFDALFGDHCPDKDIRMADCYFPRHAFVFYDHQDSAFAYIEVCLECHQYKVTNGTPFLGLCPERTEKIFSFLQSIGITYLKEERI